MSSQLRLSRAWLAALLVVAGLAVYANGLSSPFIFDDQEAILTNPNLQHLVPLRTALTAPPDTPGAGRPIVSLSFAINYALGGLSPFGYHVVNLGIHLVNGLLLFALIDFTLGLALGRTTFPRPGAAAPMAAFVSAAIWLIHPIQTEVVDYVTQRTESLMALFYLLTLYSAARAMRADRSAGRWAVLAVTACGLGMACKESMVSAPVLVLLYDVAFVSGRLGAAWRHRPRLYLGLAGTWLILAALIGVGPSIHSKGLFSDVSPWMYLLNQAPLIVRYLRLCIWPTALVLDYGVPRAVTWQEAAPYALFVGALVAATIVAWKRHKALAFLGTLFFATLAPASSVIPVATEVGAERRMYLPLAAVVVLGIAAAVRAFEPSRFGMGKRWMRSLAPAALVILCGGVCGGLAILTVRRNAEYRDPVALWRTSVARYPQPRAHFGLGAELQKRGLRVEAAAEFTQAAVEYPKAHFALGVMAAQDGRHADAVDHLSEYVRRRPFEAEVIVADTLIGEALTAEEKFGEAATAFERVLAMQPGNADARAGLAAMHTKHGIALIALGRDSDATAEFQQAVLLEPRNPVMQENLGHALAATARLDEASSHYRQALELAPGKAGLYADLGVVLVAQGRFEEAFEQFERAQTLAPNDAAIRDQVAGALRQLGRAGPRGIKPSSRPG